MEGSVLPDVAVLKLNLELQFKVKALTEENENLHANLQQSAEKLKSYEDLSQNLIVMREQLTKFTDTLIRKRVEIDKLKRDLSAVTQESQNKIQFLEQKVNFLTSLQRPQLAIDSTYDNSTDMSTVAFSGNENTSDVSCAVNTSHGSNLFLSDADAPLSKSTQQVQPNKRPLGRVENRLLSRVRGHHPRKSVSVEDLPSSGKMKKVVLQAHLQMRGRLPPTLPPLPAPAPLTKVPSSGTASFRNKITASNSALSRNISQPNLKKPFRC